MSNFDHTCSDCEDCLAREALSSCPWVEIPEGAFVSVDFASMKKPDQSFTDLYLNVPPKIGEDSEW